MTLILVILITIGAVIFAVFCFYVGVVTGEITLKTRLVEQGKA